ncbi:helix-turn-helix domain-containing protein [Flavobacterium ustbae]|uniref:helix-turn-helix domain-containing protein n=1 Tax=Flavobacterium ustbae TaxID=2488790 RepID=UPI001F388ABC|nr:helix-turn-helix transcriptional regulator [Flavobacterium ustbae]
MKMKKNENSTIISLDQFKDKHYGKIGSTKRNELDEGYESFKIGAMLLEARIQKGLTQEQLAQRSGTTKSYISKIENNVKEVRFSTLQKIVEIGLGGQLQLSIKV